MNKVILILSDALRYDVAKANMGFLGHLVEIKKLASFIRSLVNCRACPARCMKPSIQGCHPASMGSLQTPLSGFQTSRIFFKP